MPGNPHRGGVGPPGRQSLFEASDDRRMLPRRPPSGQPARPAVTAHSPISISASSAGWIERRSARLAELFLGFVHADADRVIKALVRGPAQFGRRVDRSALRDELLDLLDVTTADPTGTCRSPGDLRNDGDRLSPPPQVSAGPPPSGPGIVDDGGSGQGPQPSALTSWRSPSLSSRPRAQKFNPGRDPKVAVATRAWIIWRCSPASRSV